MWKFSNRWSRFLKLAKFSLKSISSWTFSRGTKVLNVPLVYAQIKPRWFGLPEGCRYMLTIVVSYVDHMSFYLKSESVLKKPGCCRWRLAYFGYWVGTRELYKDYCLYIAQNVFNSYLVGNRTSKYVGILVLLLYYNFL